MKKEELSKILRGKCISDESCEAAISELLDLFNVIPRKIPDSLFVEIERKKCKRYGGVFSQPKSQIDYSHGQCETIDTIEDWLKSL